MNKEKSEHEFTVERFHQYNQYFSRLKANVAVQDNLIKLADDELKIINTRLVKARQEKMAIEKLKEKKKKRYNYELQREEQDFFDEVGTVAFIKKKTIKVDSIVVENKSQFKKKRKLPNSNKEYFKTSTEKLYEEIIKKGDLL